MDLNSLSDSSSNLEQYIKNTYIIINSNELTHSFPIIHIVGMKDFRNI